ncbi:ATP-binding protein [Nocardioides mesophilus]|uniref:histidine kinase n=1 Tax=Nocardioides mesophilus TaxID=433659 RepID=A0A7G9RAH0_9ACTN|nr:ATP-binding protein [Nocardioides mesophilus]QNN52595.1 PAS domain-containing sensor histidine kinase [Nocardioides mesophilus]
MDSDGAELQRLLDALPDGVVVADETGAVVTLNSAARHLLGVGDAVGKHLSDVLSLQDNAGNDWFGCAAPYSGLSTRTALTEQSWFLPDGTEVLLTASLQRPSPSEPVSRVSVCVRSARARARLDRERSDLVATVAHELRSPLTGVKGFVATLLARWDRLNDDQKKLMLQTVNVDADRLTRLIAELLDVARIDTGRLSLYPRPVDLVTHVQRVMDSVRAGTGRELALTVEGEPPPILADPDKLAQVLHNLIDNAIRHGEGDVRIFVGADPEEPAREVLLLVDDEGDGISPEIRSRVFTKFWKHGTRGGSGLGMYIIHGLVTAHGGSVEIDDAPGGGARLAIRWPVAEVPED